MARIRARVERAGACRRPQSVAAASVRGTTKRSRRPDRGMKLGPVLDRKVDHHQPAGGKLLMQALAIVQVARCDQQRGQFLQAGVMADHQERLDTRRSLPEHVEDTSRRRIVEPLVIVWRRRRRDFGRNQVPGLARADGGRTKNVFGDQPVAIEIGPDSARRVLATAAERALMIARAGVRPSRFRVTQQKDTAHDPGHRFCPANRLPCSGPREG